MWVIFVVIHEIWKKGNIFSDVTTSQQKNSYFVNSNKFWNVGFSSEKSVLDWLAKITWNTQDYFDAAQIYLELKSKKSFLSSRDILKHFSQFDHFQNFLWLRLKMRMLIQKLFQPLCTSYWTKGYHTRLLQAVLPKSLLLSAHTWRCLFSFYQRNGINEREVAASRKRYMKYCLNCRFTFISYVHIIHRWS